MSECKQNKLRRVIKVIIQHFTPSDYKINNKLIYFSSWNLIAKEGTILKCRLLTSNSLQSEY